MKTAEQIMKSRRTHRSAAILEIEALLVQRFRDFLEGWCSERGSRLEHRNQMGEIAAFANSFIDTFHLPRVGRVLLAAGRQGDRRLERWLGKLSHYQDDFRHRLEGMLRSASSLEAGSSTSFEWAASSMVADLRRYLEWLDRSLLPELRERPTESLEQELVQVLDLDAPDEVSFYAQAESQLITLAGNEMAAR